MAGKSIIDTRTMVPEYFGNNREFQVFLRAINIALSVIKSNSDNFIPNLLNPLKCKAKLLPLLANYVGYDYNPKERVGKYYCPNCGLEVKYGQIRCLDETCEMELIWR